MPVDPIHHLLAPSILAPLLTAITAFTASNLDDIVLLLLFFSQVGQRLRPLHIVAGQYLGVGLLVLVSLGGCFGSLVFPPSWIGLLGLVPVSLGITQLMESLQADGASEQPPGLAPFGSPQRLGWPLAQTLGVAAVTVANGGDNVGIYLPLFANASAFELALTLTVFAVMVGLWCLVAWRLMQTPALAGLLTRYGRQLVPFVLIGLGGLILVDSHTLEHRGLAVVALTSVGLMLLSLLRQLRLNAETTPVASPITAGRA